jgi:hypothetical protein
VPVIRPDEDDVAFLDVPTAFLEVGSVDRLAHAAVAEDEERRLSDDSLERDAGDVGPVLEVVERSLHVRPDVAPQEDLGHDVVHARRPQPGIVGLEFLDEAVRDLERVLLLPG